MKSRFIIILTPILFILCLMMGACEKQETPVTLPPRPADVGKITQVNLGENYDQEVFVNLFDSPSVQACFPYKKWDLAFDTDPNGFKIEMNGGAGLLIAGVAKGIVKALPDPMKLKWRWDEASGGDSLVLIRWCDFNHHSNDSIYVVDRGVSHQDERYIQFKIRSVDPFSYVIELYDDGGKPEGSYTIPKNPFKNQVYFSFDERKALDLEPQFDKWHLNFLRYRWIYYEFNPPLLYYVTGIYINPSLIEVAVDSTQNFESLKKSDVVNWKYSCRRDVIGFDWKVYDFNSARYKTRAFVNYIIRTKQHNQKYYKLRFTDFYSSNGVKGSPKFELTPLP